MYISAQVWSLYKMPTYRIVFEERLIEAMTQVREATALATSICATSCIYFVATIGTSINFSSIFSMKIKDLISYRDAEIRIRCCNFVSNDSVVDESDNEGYDVDDTAAVTPAVKRLARCSMRLGESPVREMLSSSNVVTRRPSVTSFLNERNHRPEDAVLLFDSSLMDFSEGLEVLRLLFTSTSAFCALLNKIRRDSTTNAALHEGGDMSPLHELQHATYQIVELCLGLEQKYVIQQLCDDFNRIYSYDSTSNVRQCVNFVKKSVELMGLNGQIFDDMFLYFSIEASYKHLAALIGAIDATLHFAIVSCFDCTENLVPQYEANSMGAGLTTELFQPQVLNNPEVVKLVDMMKSLQLQRNNLLYASAHASVIQNDKNTLEYSSSGKLFSSYDAQMEDTSSQQDANDDWITYVDESSGKYFAYSESRNESKWL
jgi:hypothetical protein